MSNITIRSILAALTIGIIAVIPTPVAADAGVGADRNKADRERVAAWAERDRVKATQDKFNERMERINELIKGVVEGALRGGRGGGE